jgi:hypothetical protein
VGSAFYCDVSKGPEAPVDQPMAAAAVSKDGVNGVHGRDAEGLGCDFAMTESHPRNGLRQ